MAHPLDAFVNQNASLNDFRVPELPNLGAMVKDNGLASGLTKFGESMRQWRIDFERALIERIKLFQSVTLEASPAEGSVEAAPASATQAQVAIITGQLAGLLASLNAHTAATTAHGTGSRIVGANDEQTLNAKIIGTNSPRFAKFTQSVNSNIVEASEAVTISQNENMVMTGPLTVNGTLTVDGYLTIVP